MSNLVTRHLSSVTCHPSPITINFMTTTDLYKQSGVDIDAGNRAVEWMKSVVRATFTPQVLTDVGSFGGLYALDSLPPQPVPVASTDGVGTKVKLAAELGRWADIGHDIVNHCIDDILAQNACSLSSLDYIATSKLVPTAVAEVVTGIAAACQAAGGALLGGETAKCPASMSKAPSMAGTIIGLVHRGDLLPRPQSLCRWAICSLACQAAAHTPTACSSAV